MRARPFSFVVAAWLMAWSITLTAQTNQSRLMGIVIDGSGGALPGVTVTLRGAGAPSSPVVTDESGRYLSAWMAPGVYAIDFALSGFESKTVTNISLGGGQTVILDQMMALASLKETVEVTATAPAPTPPPAPPRPTRPTAKPVDREILASVCGPRQATEFSQAIGRIVSLRDDPNRQLMGPGDVLQIDAGENQGVVKGQNLVVRRRFQTGEPFAPKKLATYAEQSAGLVQIIETQADASAALVVYVCGELSAGDTVEPYIPQPAFFAVSSGTPKFDDAGQITTGASGQTAAAAGQMMVINRGIMQGAQRGQRVTIFRRPQGATGMPLTIGDGVIIAIRADSATIRIERATDAIVVGDLVALHR